MPTIEISHRDLCKLIGRNISVERLKDDILYAKGEIDGVNGDTIKIDSKDTNRPDLWSTEGIAREIAGRYGKTGLPKFRLKKGSCIVNADSRSPIQPMAVCAIAKKLKIDEHFLSQIIQLQEKLSVTLGRKRKEMSMGVYDLNRIKFPVKYTSMDRKGIRFAPLGYKKTMTADEIIKNHQKGREFGHLMHGTDEYPVWIDADKKILSMPPIINSNDVGNIDKKTKNVFIECTGYNLKFLETAIDVIAAQMLDRGAAVETVTTYLKGKKIITPRLQQKKISLDVNYINDVSGLYLNKNQIAKLIEMGRCDCRLAGSRIDVIYPSYRRDIMHKRDVAEDVLISYGYNKIKPAVPKFATTGGFSETFTKKFHDVLVGLGFQEIMNYTLSNKEHLFVKMNVPIAQTAEIENPVSSTWSVFRNSLLPGMLEIFAKNQHVEYPHKLYEIGVVVHPDKNADTKTADRKYLCAAVCDVTVSYDLISSYADALLRILGIKYELRKTHPPSFIAGRAAEIYFNNKSMGVMGEIHPQVLNNWGIEKPVVAFEINLDELK